MNDNFHPPSRGLSALVIVAGIATAIAIISGLQYWSRSLEQSITPTSSPPPAPSNHDSTPPPTQVNENDTDLVTSPIPETFIAQADFASMELPGFPISLTVQASVQTQPLNIPPVDKTTLEIAEYAWRYFKGNINPETGLVNSADGFPGVTLWDQAAGMAAVVSAREFGLITPEEFQASMGKTLETLAKLKLYGDELPNKVYNVKTLEPINYGNPAVAQEVGWSAIDLGRMAMWLKIIGARYPELRTKADAVWESWDVERLTQAGNMYGATVLDGEEVYYQEGRLGYENYAAYGLKLWGLDVTQALDSEVKAEFVNLYGVSVPYDKRDFEQTQAHNYVLSEPYFLDGIETGFQSLPQAYADHVLQAQQARYEATKQLTALTEDNLDRAPYFLYNTLFVNGLPWASISDTGENYNDLRFLSTKAAIGWHVLYNTEYTQKLYEFILENLKSEGGWQGGYYESLSEPNTSLTANNNGVILECLLFQKVRKPLLVWAGVE